MKWHVHCQIKWPESHRYGAGQGRVSGGRDDCGMVLWELFEKMVKFKDRMSSERWKGDGGCSEYGEWARD